ncbi:MAG: hypothetical protein ACTSPI_00930 [Candidatus Heimdallarchaeaceae archaeon]
MNEIYVITMNWWQLALFTIAIEILGVAIYELLPRALRKFLDRLDSEESEEK